MVSMDVEAIVVIKKNSKKNNTKGCVKAMEKLPQHILFVLFYRKTDCILKEQIVQYFLIRENLQDQSTHKSKKL